MYLNLLESIFKLQPSLLSEGLEAFMMRLQASLPVPKHLDALLVLFNQAIQVGPPLLQDFVEMLRNDCRSQLLRLSFDNSSKVNYCAICGSVELLFKLFPRF